MNHKPLPLSPNRKDYSGEYTVFLVPCTVQPTQPWIDPGDKPLSCTAHAPEKYAPPHTHTHTHTHTHHHPRGALWEEET